MVIEYTETVTSIGGVNGNVLTIGTPSANMDTNSYKDLYFIIEDASSSKLYEIISNTTTTITVRLPLNDYEGVEDLTGVEITILRYYATLKQLRARTNRISDLEIVVNDLDVDSFFDEITGDINEEIELPDGSDLSDDTNTHKTMRKSLGKILLDVVMSLIIATRQVKERTVDNVWNVYYNKGAEFSKLHLRRMSRIREKLKIESRGSKSGSVYSNDQNIKIL
jgi:hypothetical protein